MPNQGMTDQSTIESQTIWAQINIACSRTHPTLSPWETVLEFSVALQGSDGHLNVCGLEKEEALLALGKCHAKNLGAIQPNRNQQQQTYHRQTKKNQQDKDAPR